MEPVRHARVVAGVDFSPESDRAVEVAAGEALRRRAELRLTHVVRIPEWYSQLSGVRHPERVVDDAEERLRSYRDAVQRRYPALDVSSLACGGHTATVLAEESERADLVVVGRRGRGAFQRMVLGSVAGRLPELARCPVIVAGALPDPQDTSPHPVMACVDGSAHAMDVLRFAAAEATARGCGLIAVHVWSLPDWGGSARVQAERDLGALMSSMVEDAVQACQTEFPGLRIETRLVHNISTAHGLVDTADLLNASLVVAGTRARHEITGLVLGSVSRNVLLHARRPVAVVPLHAPALEGVTP